MWPSPPPMASSIPDDSSMDIDDIPLERCSAHRHIRECFTAEMDRYMAEKEVRFLDDTCVGQDEEEDRFVESISPQPPSPTAEPHDPRIGIMVDNFMAARMSIPMGEDADGLPILCPAAPSRTASLDAIEDARLAMAQKSRVSRQLAQSNAAAQRAIALSFATVMYVKAVHHLNNMNMEDEPSAHTPIASAVSPNPDYLAHVRPRATTYKALISAYATEKRVLIFTRSLIRTYLQDKQHAAVIANGVADRLQVCKEVLEDDQERAAINEDDLASAAVASHAKCLHVTMAQSSFRSWRRAQEEQQNRSQDMPPAPEMLAELQASILTLPAPPSPDQEKENMDVDLQEEEAQQAEEDHITVEDAKAEVLQRYTVAERALQELKKECHGQAMCMPNIQFDIYPAQARGQRIIRFNMSMRMYAQIHRARA